VNIVIDFDNTVYNSTRKVCDFHNIIYNKNVDWKLVRNWNLDDQCSFKNPEREVENIFDDKMFYQKQYLYKDSIKYINKLCEKYEVNFCTIGNPKNIYHKSNLIRQYFPKAGIMSLTNIKNKGMIDLSESIFIDDKLHNLLNSDAKYRWLFEHKKIRMNFNSHFNDHSHQVESVSKWNKIYDKVEEMCNG